MIRTFMTVVRELSGLAKAGDMRLWFEQGGRLELVETFAEDIEADGVAGVVTIRDGDRSTTYRLGDLVRFQY